MVFGVVSYGASAAAFLLLTVLLLASRQRGRSNVSLVAASALTAVWSALLALQAATGRIAAVTTYTAEIVHGGAWLVALGAMARSTIPRVFAIGSHLLWIGVLIALMVAFSGLYPGRFNSGLIFSRGALAIAVFGLVLLEQLYRNADAASRPALKYFLLGVGGLFSYDIFLYSQAELLQGIKLDAWQARGAVTALCAPLIALAIRRSPDSTSTLFVSRHVVFHTTAILGVGGYLLLMAMGGYYIRSVGGTWSGIAEILFLVMALVGLLMLSFSGQLRRRLLVFIAKHFYRNKYDYRIEWLRFIRTLSANEEADVYRTALRAVTQIFASPGGVLLTLDETGRELRPIAAWPLELDAVPSLADIPANSDLCHFLLQRQWIVDLDEYRRSPEVYDNIPMPEWLLALRDMRIISPMMELDHLVGIFLLYSPPAPFKLTFEDRDLLRTVGQHVATQIAQHQADRKLAEGRQFEAYNKLTAFMMHDLKNSVAQLQLVVANAQRHKANPEFIDDAISTIANAVRRMNHLVAHLQAGNSPPAVMSVPLNSLIAAAVARCSDRHPVPKYVGVPGDVVINADPERLEAIVEHVIRNAQDASTIDGAVEVEVMTSDGEVTVSVLDGGPGMTGTFVRERLFRPFDSTKGSKGMGIGAYQTREYVRMLGGDVKVQSSPGKGTRFSIILPRLTGAGLSAVSGRG